MRGMGVIWLEPQLGKRMGWGPTSPAPTREGERRGTTPSRRATWDPWVPAWAPTGRAHGSPARNWGEEGGRRRRRPEGGDRTCLISPQAPRAIPTPRGMGRKGKRAGGGGRGGRTLGFPQPRGEELTLWGLDSQRLALWGPPRSGRAAPPPARGTHVGPPHPYRVDRTYHLSPCAPLLAQPAPFQPAARGCSLRPRARLFLLHPSPPSAFPTPVSPPR